MLTFPNKLQSATVDVEIIRSEAIGPRPALPQVAELETLEEKVRLTLDTIPCLVYTLGADCEIQYANPFVIAYLGKTLEDLRSGAWVAALHPGERDSVLAAKARLIAEAKPHAMEYRLRRFDGVYRRFRAALQPLIDRRGDIIRWYGVLTDIEDYRNAEEALLHTQALSLDSSQATSAQIADPSIVELIELSCALLVSGRAALKWLAASPPNIEKAYNATENLLRYGKELSEVFRPYQRNYLSATNSRTRSNASSEKVGGNAPFSTAVAGDM